MIAVIARLTAKAGQEAALESALRELGEQVRAHEPDCKLYQLCRGKTAGKFVMIERYASQAALEAHGKTPYFGAAGKTLGALLDGRAEIEILTEL